MMLNNIEISKAFLESGDSLKLTEHLDVKHPSVAEILSLGNGITCDKVYWNYVFTLLCDPYDNMVWLDDNGVDYEDVTAFDVFLMKWDNCIDQYRKNTDEYDKYGILPIDFINEALRFFLGEHTFSVGQYEDGTRALYDTLNQNIQINADIFHYISAFIQLLNGISHVGRINPANKNAKKILIEDKRDEQKKLPRKKKEDSNDYFGDMISAVVHGGNGGITPFNFRQLKFYQLYASMKVEQKKLHFNHVMSGVYQGTVTYDKIDKQELNWMG